MLLLILLKIKLYAPPHTKCNYYRCGMWQNTLPPNITEVKRVPIPTPTPSITSTGIV